MSPILTEVPLAALDDHSRLFLDYVGNFGKGIEPFLPATDPGGGFAKRLAPIRKSIESEAGGAWEELRAEIAELSERLGTNPDVVDKLRGRARPNFVITGQQPGVFGGPLLAAYKIATAVALADRLEKNLGQPVIPLYWCGSDDVDFAEIRAFNMLTADLDPVAASLPQSAHRPGTAVGAIRREVVGEIWKTLLTFTEAFGEHAFVEGVVSDGLSNGKDHGEVAASVLVSLFRGRVAVVDGRSESVRRCAQPVLKKYVEEESDIKSEIADRGAELEKAGYHAQLVTGADSGIFLIEEGVRKNVTAERRAALEDAVKKRVETCSPGVIARNLVQDYALKPLAVVLGPAEIAYRAQIGGLYKKFSIPRPVDVPRMTATFLPGSLAALLGDGSLDPLELLRDPHAAARTLYRRAVPRELCDAMEAMERDVKSSIERFKKAAADHGAQKAQGKIQSRLKDLQKRVDGVVDATLEAGKVEALGRWPGLADIDKTVRPGHKPQERTLATLAPFLFGGEHTSDVLLESARRYLGDLLDGRPAHIVYSTQ